MDVRFSVIITSYNVERYIERSIKSALSQNSVTLEVVVVDDASTDNSWAIISSIVDPRIKSIRLDKNSGTGAARNACLAIATGKWLAILDGDDAFLPGRLERCLRLGAKENADIIVDNLIVHKEESGAEFPMFPPSKFSRLGVLDHATFIKGPMSFFSNYTLGYLKPVFSADFLRKHSLKYDTGMRIGEDYLLLAEALAKGARCAVLGAAGYRYTARSGSISHRLSAEDVTKMLDGDARYLANCHLNDAAKNAQSEREQLLRKLYAFALLVDAIKKCDMAGAASAIISYPTCIFLLWEAALVRIKRCMK